jgi:hypothetical protein
VLLVAAAVMVGLSLLLPAIHRRMLRRPLPPPDRSSPQWRDRQDALTRAQVFVRVAHEGPIASDDPLTCRYLSKTTSGTSPKFECRLESGEVIKVKYGGSPEIPAETASARLLAALGFGADHMSRVRLVRCYGCPPSPYRVRRTFEHMFAERLFEYLLDYGRVREFADVSVERKMAGRAFEMPSLRGWGFNELDAVDARKGGASRADVDALRLTAVLLGHWDNKPDNQRLVCLEADAEASAAPCRQPLLMLLDVGSTFGARSAGFDGWRHAPIWLEPKDAPRA